MTTLKPTASPRLVVILASTGRPDMLSAALHHWRRQSRKADRIILSVVSDRDLPGAAAREGCTVVSGPRGLPAQRNRALRLVEGKADYIAFFDDDYLPSRHCLERLEAFLESHPDVAGATGRLLADGARTTGVPLGAAERMLRDYDREAPPPHGDARCVEGLYGCNMAYRAASIAGLAFDERLKLYGWQEDIDFAVQAGRRGRTVATDAFVGVHLGTKGARASGLRLGYSQVQNPLYLWGKGTMSARFARKLILRNLMANHLRSLAPEPWVDRVGRVKGNWLGLVDALRGRLTPERIEEL
ncbi:glycosyltransferase family 2 protein [Novosphingobium sp. FKTRR1]|uniref:glycosyltransferase family 2 protein n=1 Tax=Novosphingobium sp. FKTRR1 TaxID=2879118 RepID=UPI001CEFD838